MKPLPALSDRDYPFGEEVYPLAELAMSEAPPALAAFLTSQAENNGVELIRDEVVELICISNGMAEQRFTVYWPSGAGMHVLVPRRHVIGRA